MKNLLALMLSIFALTASASHHSEYVDTRDDGTTTRISVVHDDNEHYATYEKNGVTHTSWEIRGAEFRLLDRASNAAGHSAPDADEPPQDGVNAADDIPL